jgi:hypothetical protein
MDGSRAILAVDQGHLAEIVAGGEQAARRHV